MKKFIIKRYVDKLSIQDIDNFAKSNNILLDNEEINYIYNFVKNNWQNILNDNDLIITEIREKFSGNKANDMEKLYFEYKNKYKNFLNN